MVTFRLTSPLRATCPLMRATSSYHMIRLLIPDGIHDVTFCNNAMGKALSVLQTSGNITHSCCDHAHIKDGAPTLPHPYSHHGAAASHLRPLAL